MRNLWPHIASVQPRLAGRQCRSITPEKFMRHVDAYIRWYNERRIKLSLGAVRPEMYRQQCGVA